jgi:hypothetical protein
VSARTTVGGSGENAEALLSLARAFFYAGARALLVALGGGLCRRRQAHHGHMPQFP